MSNMDFTTPGHLSSEFPWVIIEKLREIKGISKKDLASKLQINYSYLVDLLNGRYPSKIDNQKIQILSEILNIPVNDLLGYLTNQSIPDLTGKSGESEKSSQPMPEIPESELPIKESTPLPNWTTGQAGIPDFQIPLINHRSESRLGGTDFDKIISSLEGETPEYYTGLLEQSELQPSIVGSNSSRKSGLKLPHYKPAYLNNPNILAIKLQDDSMFPPFNPGTIFMLHKKTVPKLNEIVFIILRDGRAWLREWNGTEGSELILKPYNPKYDYLQILSKDIVALYPMVGVEITDNPDYSRAD